MANPVGGEWIEDEFHGIARYGIKRLVSLLEPQEIRELGLAKAAELCAANQIEYLHFPIKDRGIPSSPQKLIELTEDIYRQILLGKNTVVHCRAGIGRTGLLAASVLVKHGHSPEQAFELASKARGVSMPDTQEQYNWVVQNQKALQSA